MRKEFEEWRKEKNRKIAAERDGEEQKKTKQSRKNSRRDRNEKKAEHSYIRIREKHWRR